MSCINIELYFVLIYTINKYCLTKSLLCVKISDQVNPSERNDAVLHSPRYTCPYTRARGEIYSEDAAAEP